MHVVIVGAGSGRAVGRVPPGRAGPRRGGGGEGRRPRRAGGAVRGRRLPVRHRAQRPHHDRLLADVFAAAGEDMAGHLTLVPVDPMYRACFADGSELRVWHDREPHAGRDPRPGRPGRGGGLRPVLRLARPPVQARAAQLHRPQLRLAPRPGLAPRPDHPPGAHGRLPQAQPRWSSRTSPTPGCSRSSASRPCTRACPRSRPWPCTASSPTWTRSRACTSPWAGCTPSPGAWPRRPRRRGPPSATAPTVEGLLRPGFPTPGSRVTGVRLAGGEVIHGRRRRPQPRPARRLRGLLPDVAPPRVHPQGHVLAVVLGVAGRREGRPARRAPPTTTSTSAPEWEGAFENLLTRGVPMDDPSILVTSPTVTDPSLAPAGRTSLYVLEPMPNLDGKVDWATRRRPAARPAHRQGGRPRLPRRRHRGRALRRPARLASGRAWPGARRSPCPTTSSRPAPSAPATSTAKAPGVVFVGSGTVPGVGVPMVLLSGRLAADRVERMKR